MVLVHVRPGRFLQQGLGVTLELPAVAQRAAPLSLWYCARCDGGAQVASEGASSKKVTRERFDLATSEGVEGAR